MPRLFFMEMELGGLAIDPLLAPADELPYAHIEHLRDCLIGLAQQPEKPTKTVSRYLRSDISFATIKNGFFIGDQQEICHYPFPAHEELLRDHYDWWQSVRIGALDITAVPARHFSGLSVRFADQDATLWAGWVVRGPQQGPNDPPPFEWIHPTVYGEGCE